MNTTCVKLVDKCVGCVKIIVKNYVLSKKEISTQKNIMEELE